MVLRERIEHRPHGGCGPFSRGFPASGSMPVCKAGVRLRRALQAGEGRTIWRRNLKGQPQPALSARFPPCRPEAPTPHRRCPPPRHCCPRHPGLPLPAQRPGPPAHRFRHAIEATRWTPCLIGLAHVSRLILPISSASKIPLALLRRRCDDGLRPFEARRPKR